MSGDRVALSRHTVNLFDKLQMRCKLLNFWLLQRQIGFPKWNCVSGIVTLLRIANEIRSILKGSLITFFSCFLRSLVAVSFSIAYVLHSSEIFSLPSPTIGGKFKKFN